MDCLKLFCDNNLRRVDDCFFSLVETSQGVNEVTYIINVDFKYMHLNFINN